MADPEKGDSGLVVLGSEDSENEQVVEIKPLLDNVFVFFTPTWENDLSLR